MSILEALCMWVSTGSRIIFSPLSYMQSVMKKLELYNFANASHWMTQQTQDESPYIESICNQRDTVSIENDTKREQADTFPSRRSSLHDLEAFSHIPTDGSFGALSVQTTP